MENVLQNAPQLLILIFLVITFLQSGIDKIVDWDGNNAFLKEHFSKTFLKSLVTPMLLTITVFEIIAGILSTIGIIEILVYNGYKMALYGAIFSCIVLLMLLFGQRIAKDYAGALTITCYFVIAILGVFLLTK